MKVCIFLIFATCCLLPCYGQERYAPIPQWYNDYDVKFYKIDVEVDHTTARVKGCAEVIAEIGAQGLKQFTLELAEAVRVDSVRLNGRVSAYRREGDLLHVGASDLLPTGSTCRVMVYYAALDLKEDGFFSAVSNQKDNAWDIPVTWTFSEPFNAKKWFPCKQHLPDKADSVYVFITVPDNLKAGAPGVLSAVRPMPDGKLRYEWKSRYPTAFYLLSFAVADYREYTVYAHPKGTDKPVPVQNYIYNREGYLNKHKAIIDTTATLIEFLSELYLPYPFADEKYGHCVAPMGGGMEHQTMTTLSDFDFLLVAHELAHQWFGNLVTCASFQDVWINEGFTTYTEYLALEHMAPREEALKWLREAHSLASWSPTGSVFVPAEAADDHWRIFSMSLSYKKGALLVHNLRRIVDNDSLFFDVLRGFLRKYSFSVATGTDFKRYLEEQTGMDFTLFFDQWYYGGGFPKVDISWKKTGEQLEMLVEHIGSAPKQPVFTFDMDVRIKKADGSDTLVILPIRTGHDSFNITVGHNDVTDVEADPNYYIMKQMQNVAQVRDLPTSDNFVNCNTHIKRRQNLSVVFGKTTARHCSVKLTDTSGERIFAKLSANRKKELSVPMEQLPNATYLLYVQNGEQLYVRKIVKSMY